MRMIIAPYATRQEQRARQAWRWAVSRIDIADAERSRLLGAHWAAASAHARAFARWPDLRTPSAVASDIAAACSLRKT
jgi:hypothetical protein